MEKMPEKVKFIHNIPKDYRIYPVNGAWGGITGRGDMVMHFFVERHPIPPTQVQSVKADGTLAPVKKEPKKEVEVARDMQVGIMITREQTIDIAKWMLEKVKQFEKLTSKGGKQP